MRRKSGLKPILLLAVALVLIGLLLVAQSSSYHGFIALPFLLAPVFLYGLVALCLSLLAGCCADEAVRVPAPSRPCLFQRPPPSLLR